MSNEFWNGLIAEKSRLKRRLEAVEQTIEAYGAGHVDMSVGKTGRVKRKYTKRNVIMAPISVDQTSDSKARKQWILEYFQKGNQASPEALLAVLAKENFKVNYKTLYAMLMNMEELEKDPVTRLFRIKPANKAEVA